AHTEAGPVAGTSTASFAGISKSSTWPEPAVLTMPWKQQGERAPLTLSHEGQGKPWATVQVLAATVAKDDIVHGLSVHKTVVPYKQRVPGQWSEGDVMEVTLDLTSDRDLGWLVVNDPIPSGAVILDDRVGNDYMWWWTPSFIERGSDAFRGYYQRVWEGKWRVSYRVRLNNGGTVRFPSTRLEVMYAPEIFGETPGPALEVKADTAQ